MFRTRFSLRFLLLLVALGCFCAWRIHSCRVHQALRLQVARQYRLDLQSRWIDWIVKDDFSDFRRWGVEIFGGDGQEAAMLHLTFSGVTDVLVLDTGLSNEFYEKLSSIPLRSLSIVSKSPLSPNLIANELIKVLNQPKPAPLGVAFCGSGMSLRNILRMRTISVLHRKGGDADIEQMAQYFPCVRQQFRY